MNNYFVVATAKHTLNLRGKQYKIGEPIPTELTEKEWNFYKDALNVESVKSTSNNIGDFNGLNKTPTPTNVNDLALKNIVEQLAKKDDEIAELKAKIAELKSKSVVAESETTDSTETEVKPKKPSGRPKKDS